MKASLERNLIRWFHILASIPLVGYIYGPVSEIPEAKTAVRWVLFPLIVLSGLWLWQGHRVKKWLGINKKSRPIQGGLTSTRRR